MVTSVTERATFARLTIEAILMTDGGSDSKIQ